MKKGVYYDLVKKVNAIDSNRQNLKEKVKKKTPDTSKFNLTQKFNRSWCKIDRIIKKHGN